MRERAERAAQAAREAKDDRVAEDGVDAQLAPLFIIWRGEDEVAIVSALGSTQGWRDLMPIAERLAGGFRADSIAAVTETWHATKDTDPDTGKGWAAGGMGDYVERHGRNNGVIREAVHAVVVNSAGDHSTAMQAFEARTSAFGGARVEWDAKPRIAESVDGQGMTGWVIDGLVDAMHKASDIGTFLAKVAVDGGMEPEVADAAADAAAVKLLAETVPDVAVFLASRKDQAKRVAYLEDSLGQPSRDTVEGAVEVAMERARRGEG